MGKIIFMELSNSNTLQMEKALDGEHRDEVLFIFRCCLEWLLWTDGQEGKWLQDDQGIQEQDMPPIIF